MPTSVTTWLLWYASISMSLARFVPASKRTNSTGFNRSNLSDSPLPKAWRRPSQTESVLGSRYVRGRYEKSVSRRSSVNRSRGDALLKSSHYEEACIKYYDGMAGIVGKDFKTPSIAGVRSEVYVKLMDWEKIHCTVCCNSSRVHKETEVHRLGEFVFSIWSSLELIQRLPCLEQEPVNEEEPKVINLILCSLLDMMSVWQIITDAPWRNSRDEQD